MISANITCSYDLCQQNLFIMKTTTRLCFITSIALLSFIMEGCTQKEFTWTNPLNGLEFRDTHIIPHDGRFYAVGTCEPFWGGPNPGVKLYSSDDLRNWKFEKLLIDAFALDSNVWYRDRFWAPELRKIGSTWYLTFNCQNNSGSYADPDMKHFHACGVATASEITGPYTVRTHEKPLTSFPSNDISLFEDEDNRVYAFFNNGWTNIHKIFVAELDTVTVTLKEEPVELFSQSSGSAWDSNGIEGAHVIKHEGTYYLFYSSWTMGYAVGYATATNVYGPWKKYDKNPLFGAYSRDGKSYIVREGVVIEDPQSPLINAGHNQVFTGPDGRMWTSYHGNIKGEAKTKTLIDPLWFEEGVIKTTAPGYTTRSVPIAQKMLRRFPGLAMTENRKLTE